MSLDGRLTRRKLLQSIAAATAALGAGPSSDAVAQSPRLNTKETYRDHLAPLIKNPEWSIPATDGSEAAKLLYSQIGMFEKYYSSERGKGHLQAGIDRLLANNAEHLTMVLATAKKYGVPKEITFLALAESHWFGFGENSAKAAGYWQFIPATAHMYGLQNVPTGSKRQQSRYNKQELEARGDERLNPVKSTDAAMRYLSFLKRFFDKVAANHGLTVGANDAWTFAMWAYNRGPGHVRKTFIATKGNPLLYSQTLLDQPVASKNTGSKVVAARKESAGYVPKILAIRAQVARLVNEPPPRPAAPPPTPKEPLQPEEHETSRETEEDVEIISYKVQGGDNLTKIATWISPDPDFVQLRMDQIRDYNEHVIKRKLPDQVNKNEILHIPALHVTIAPGDTLEKIARTYCSGWPTNVAINHLRYLNGLRPGVQLQANKTFIVPLQNN